MVSFKTYAITVVLLALCLITAVVLLFKPASYETSSFCADAVAAADPIINGVGTPEDLGKYLALRSACHRYSS